MLLYKLNSQCTHVFKSIISENINDCNSASFCNDDICNVSGIDGSHGIVCNVSGLYSACLYNSADGRIDTHRGLDIRKDQSNEIFCNACYICIHGSDTHHPVHYNEQLWHNMNLRLTLLALSLVEVPFEELSLS